MITLYDYWRSSAAYRVRVALNLLGLTYASVPVDLAKGEHKLPENLARNPQGQVPSLDIDGLRLTQSLAILEYLAETRGGLLPDDSAGRARVRALSHVIAMDTAPICNLSVRTHVASISTLTAEDWQRHYMGRGLAGFEAMLGHPGRYCHGDVPTMADFCLVPLVYNAQRVGIDVASFPRSAEIVANLAQLPAVQAAHPDKVKP